MYFVPCTFLTIITLSLSSTGIKVSLISASSTSNSLDFHLNPIGQDTLKRFLNSKDKSLQTIEVFAMNTLFG